jgi:hypothetical protein
VLDDADCVVVAIVEDMLVIILVETHLSLTVEAYGVVLVVGKVDVVSLFESFGDVVAEVTATLFVTVEVMTLLVTLLVSR